jgi:hypothetical protein
MVLEGLSEAAKAAEMERPLSRAERVPDKTISYTAQATLDLMRGILYHFSHGKESKNSIKTSARCWQS